MKVKARLLNLEEEHTRLLSHIDNLDKEVYGITCFLMGELDKQADKNQVYAEKLKELEDGIATVISILQQKHSYGSGDKPND